MTKTSKPANLTPVDDDDADVEVPAFPRTFTWQGIDFTVDDPADWPIGALRAFERGHQIDAIARVIGDAAFERIADMPASKTTELFHKIAEVAGFADAGE